MAITVDLDAILAKQKISLKELSRRTGISTTDLKTLKSVQFRDPRFAMLENICKALDCNIADVLKSETEK